MNEAVEKPEPRKRNPFIKASGYLIRSVEGLRQALPLVNDTITEAHQRAADGMGQLITDLTEKAAGHDGEGPLPVAPSDMGRLVEHSYNWQRTAAASQLVSRSFVVTLVSVYDAFVGYLIRAIFQARPELLNHSDKQLTFSQLMEFETIEDAREYIIEKEIETVLRGSHAEQFSWLERRLGTPLRKGLDSWPRFIELTERRNLFVHSDGRVSRQYLAVCEREGGLTFDPPDIGNELAAPSEYFQRAVDTVLEIGIKLTQVAWRKLVPAEIEMADGYFCQVCYEKISSCEYPLALALLDFAVTLPRFSSDASALRFLVNRAQTLKWLGRDKECLEVLDSVDWSAKSDEYRLANHALRRQWDDAARAMVQIGPGPEMLQAYHDWPLFKEFRETDYFLDTYHEVFGEAFTDGLDEESQQVAAVGTVTDDLSICAEEWEETPAIEEVHAAPAGTQP